MILERKRQDEQWGQQDHASDRWMCILMEEVGEAAETSLRDDMPSLREELVQVAAVAVAAIECLDREEEIERMGLL